MNIEIETVLMLKYIDVIYQDFPRSTRVSDVLNKLEKYYK